MSILYTVYANDRFLGIDATVGERHHSPGFEIMPNRDVLGIVFSGDGLAIMLNGPAYREEGNYIRIVQARLPISLRLRVS